MRYQSNADLPGPVQHHLADHPQHNDRNAFNHADAERADDLRREEVADRIAAVNRSYVKVGNSGIAKVEVGA